VNNGRVGGRLFNIPFAAGNFTCVGGLATWTVALADVLNLFIVELNERLVYLSFNIVLTTVNIGAGNTNGLLIALPVGYRPVALSIAPAMVTDNAVPAIGICVADPAAATVLRCSLVNAGNFAASAAQTSVGGQIIYQRA